MGGREGDIVYSEALSQPPTPKNGRKKTSEGWIGLLGAHSYEDPFGGATGIGHLYCDSGKRQKTKRKKNLGFKIRQLTHKVLRLEDLLRDTHLFFAPTSGKLNVPKVPSRPGSPSQTTSFLWRHDTAFVEKLPRRSCCASRCPFPSSSSSSTLSGA